MKISKIFLYDEPFVPQIQLKRLAEFLKERFPVNVEIRDSILKNAQINTSEEIASCRIMNTIKPFERHKPTMEEILFEMQNVANSDTRNIIMYDGFEIQQILSKLIPDDEKNIECFHICFTNKLTCTYDYNDYRYHGRAIICSNPSIISTTGIIEAPAKPREYYIEMLEKYRTGLNIESLKKKFRGTFLEYNDSRLSKIIEGYIMQSIFYYETGDAFCQDKKCRLFNAHWQKDLMYAQLDIGNLCQTHQKILEEMTIT